MATITKDRSEKAILEGVKNVAGFLRISTEKTDNLGKKVNIEKTLKNHKEKMLAFLKERKWNDFELFEEVVSGGKDLEERAELERLLEHIGEFDAILCMELTRLSRQGLSSQIIKNECKKRGILIITMNPFKVYNMQIPQDVFLYDLSISMGEYERELTSLRVKQNKISMAHQGLNSSGSVPYGYVRNPKTKKLEIETVEDENGNKVESEKAAIVRQIFDWYLQGEGQRTICDRLNEMGIKNKSGRKWIPNSLRVLLTCPTYKGTLVAHSYEIEKGKMVPVETVTKDGNHDPIIDPEIWDKAQRLRNYKKERSGIDRRSNDWNSKKHMSILDGLVYCDCCHRKSTIKFYKSKDNFYIIKCTRFDASGKTCTNGGISVKDIEKAVFTDILKEKHRIEKRMKEIKSDDFSNQVKDLEEKKNLLVKQKTNLEVQWRAIRQQEQTYIMSGVKDDFEEEMIAEDKRMNQLRRAAVNQEIAEVDQKLQEQPSAEQEIKRLQEKIDIIEELETKDLDVHQVNILLKQIILKINYKRELPDNYRVLARTEKERFPAEVSVDFIK